MFLRKWIPKTMDDRIAFVVFLAGVHLVAFYELFVILPYIDADRKTIFWSHAILGFFIYCNIMTCFIKLVEIDSSTKGHVLPTVLKPGWRYCSECETNSPPRLYNYLYKIQAIVLHLYKY